MSLPDRPDRSFTKAVNKALFRVTVLLSTVTLIGIVVVMISGIAARAVFGTALPWSEEMARILLVWCAFLGGVAASSTGAQIRVDSFPVWIRRKSPRGGLIVDGLTLLLGIAAVWIWAWASIDLFGPSAQATSPATGIPALYTRIALPIACALMSLAMIMQFIDVLRGEHRSDTTEIEMALAEESSDVEGGILGAGGTEEGPQR